jgi:deoxyribonuclease V
VGVTERRLMPGGEDIARAVVTRVGRRPVIVHPGWQTDVETAVWLVERLPVAARTPEP